MHVNLGLSVILILTSIAEGWETLQEDLVQLQAGVHHGVFIFGFVNLLRVLPDLFVGAELATREAGE